MKDRRMQRMLSETVATTPLIPEKNYHLCWWDEQIQCRPVRHTPKSHEVFYSAPDMCCSKGFPSINGDC